MYKEIPIKEYDEKLPDFFEREKEHIEENLEGDFELQHIGSTAVPGLGGKNWIDILLLVEDRETAEAMIERVKDLGYTHSESAGDEHRMFFKRRGSYFGEEKRFHLHLMWKGEDSYKDLLLFRDYLREHPEEAERYYRLKKKWKKRAKNSDEFTDLKTDYIENIVEKAKEEQSS